MASPPPELYQTITAEGLAELLRGAGYRAEILADAAGGPVIRSACAGTPFLVRLGNPTDDRTAHLDATFLCQLELPEGGQAEGLARRWNGSRRFARAHARGPVAVLEQDLLVAGGVTAAHGRLAIEIWDSLVQDFLQAARAAAAVPAEATATAPPLAIPPAEAMPDRTGTGRS